MAVVQRGEMVHRIADEIETMIIELGVDARLLRLQLDELYGEIDDELDLVVADYLPPGRTVADTLAEMSRLSDDDVLDLKLAANTLHLKGDTQDLTREAAAILTEPRRPQELLTYCFPEVLHNLQQIVRHGCALRHVIADSECEHFERRA